MHATKQTRNVFSSIHKCLKMKFGIKCEHVYVKLKVVSGVLRNEAWAQDKA